MSAPKMSPLMAVFAELASIPIEDLRRYCAEHPSAEDACVTCGEHIAETPWCSPDGAFHLCGWIHTVTCSSACGGQWPYKFAEPTEVEPAKPPTAVFDEEGYFLGHHPRACGEHRTVGSHRAWCFSCGSWCYPHDGCIRCRHPEG